MSRVNALNVTQTDGSSIKAQLAEIYGEIIENVQKNTISTLLKNKHLSGDFDAGSVEANRIENASSKPYGTARAKGKADPSKVKPVPVPMNINREMLKEFEKYDLKRIGIVDLMKREKRNMQLGMERELETAFFQKAYDVGTEVIPTSNETIQQINEVILSIEKTKNSFVNGVPRALINVICDPMVYQEIRDYLDTNTNNSNVDTSLEEFGKRHGVSYFSSVYLPSEVKFEVMVEESVAEPVSLDQYDANGTIPLSNATADGFFYDYGCEGVMPDLIKYVAYKQESEV